MNRYFVCLWTFRNVLNLSKFNTKLRIFFSLASLIISNLVYPLSWFQIYVYVVFRNSHQGCPIRKSVHRNFTKFIGKHLYQSLFFNKVSDLRPATLLKKRLWHRCFPVNLAKFLRKPFLQDTSGRLLLSIHFFNFYSLHNIS